VVRVLPGLGGEGRGLGTPVVVTARGCNGKRESRKQGTSRGRDGAGGRHEKKKKRGQTVKLKAPSHPALKEETSGEELASGGVGGEESKKRAAASSHRQKGMRGKVGSAPFELHGGVKRRAKKDWGLTGAEPRGKRGNDKPLGLDLERLGEAEGEVREG